jgi:hypothetical protein
MKRTKRFNEGGMSLEEMYPEAKITRAGPQPKPAEPAPAKSAHIEMMREANEAELRKSLAKAATPEYERKAEKFEKTSSGRGVRGGGGGGSSGAADLKQIMNPRSITYKKGGKVSSASSRADGCCVKGKTRGKMM